MFTIRSASCLMLMLAAASSAATAQVLYSNGPVDTGPVTRSGVLQTGTSRWAEAQNTAGVYTAANTATSRETSNYQFDPRQGADDFTVPAGDTWTLSSIDFFVSTSLASNVTGAYLQILDGPPDGGGNVLFGDADLTASPGTLTNRLAGVTATNLQLVSNTAAPSVNGSPFGSAVFRVRANTPGAVLGPGTYWVRWFFTTSGPFTSAATALVNVYDVRATGAENARTYNTSTGFWDTVKNSQSLSGSGPSSGQREYAFEVRGTATNPNPAVMPGAPSPLRTAGGASPSIVFAGAPSVKVYVTAIPGLNPSSASYTASIDLSPIGGPSVQPMFDDGSNGDATVGDGVFTVTTSISGSTTPGVKDLPFTLTDDRARVSTGAVHLAVGASVGGATPEVEPNESKATATPLSLIPGAAVTGSSAGSSTAAGVSSIDYFLISLPASNGITLNSLELVSSTPGYNLSMRGRTQNATGACCNNGTCTITRPPPNGCTQSTATWYGDQTTCSATAGCTAPPPDPIVPLQPLIDATSDTSAATASGQGFASLGARRILFYTHGGATTPRIYVSVSGSPTTTQPYYLRLTQTPITPATLAGGPFTPGPITISNVGVPSVGFSALAVYDSSFAPINGYRNSRVVSGVRSGIPDALGPTGIPATGANSQLTRNYAPGTYYIAIATNNHQYNLPSAADDTSRDSNSVMDFPGVTLCNDAFTFNGTPLGFNFSVTDACGLFPIGPLNCTGTPRTFGYAVDAPQQIAWFAMTVGSPSVICCRGSTCAVVAQGACTLAGPTQAGALSAGAGAACTAPGAATAPCCKADYTKVNGVDLLDIFAFLADWFGGVAYADFNGQGGVDLLDIFGFLEAWFTGCP